MINAGNAEWFAIDEIATAIGGWCARRMQCRVGKIAGHCDDDCAKLRNLAHAVAARVGCVGDAPVCRAALFGAAREENQGI
jgi:hypothetical protein